MRRIAQLVPLALLAGCFTLSQTEMPTVETTRAPQGRETKVSVTGFAATITEYIPIYGYETVYVDHGPYHRGRHGRHVWGGHYETMTTETLVPHAQASETFLRRAQVTLEDAGYLVRAPRPDYTVDVAFAGPFVRDGERAVEFAWQFLSLLSAEYVTQTWTAKLRIYDAKTGRVLFTKDFSQKYEDCEWSPLFFIGLAGCTENTFNYIQSWCLTALTDQAVADATAFLAKR